VEPVKLDGGYALLADASEPATRARVREITGCVPLILTDPPYGKILSAKWDHVIEKEEDFVEWMIDWTRTWSDMLLPGGMFAVWGGIGTPGFRPFFRYIPEVERRSELKLSNLITWSKKRAYGTATNFLFTREELALFTLGDVKRPRCFNIPLLETKRPYPGFNADYPAKSEYYRRTNVWTDITELLRGKVHPAQKAQRVMEIPIEVYTQSGEWVVDMFVGSGTTALAARKLGRRFFVIEKDEKTFEEMVERLRSGTTTETGAVQDGWDEL